MIKRPLLAIVVITLCVSCNHGTLRKPTSATSSLVPRFSSLDVSQKITRHALLVVHATEEFDEDQQATAGINKLIAEFKASGKPVFYLVHDQSERGYRKWYTKDRSPDFEIFSEGGEHNLLIAADEVTIVGGFFGSTDHLNGCHALAVRDAIRMHFEVSEKPFTIHMPLNAIYFYDEFEENRRQLISGSWNDFRWAGTNKYPFASLFFLREGNNGAGDDGNEQNFAHDYFGMENKKYRHGHEVSRIGYRFQFYLNDKSYEPAVGSGKRMVKLKLSTR